MITEELRAVQEWATASNLKLNASKSKEMLVARPLVILAHPPPPHDIELVTEMLILGVIRRGDLHASSHMHHILSLCTNSFHTLRVLRWHGLFTEALSTVTGATTISCLLCASPALWDLPSAEDCIRLESFLRRPRRLQFLPSSVGSFLSLAKAADIHLLREVVASNNHMLHQFLLPVAQRTCVLFLFFSLLEMTVTLF